MSSMLVIGLMGAKAALPRVATVVPVQPSSLSAPTNLRAEVGWDTGEGFPNLTLTWDAVAGATDYALEYSSDRVSWFSLASSGGPTTYSWDNGDFGTNENKFVRVRATDGVTTTDPSNVAGACLLTTPGSGTFAFPVGATTRVVVCVGAGRDGFDLGALSGGGGGGALSIKTFGNSEVAYNYNVPAANAQDNGGCDFSFGGAQCYAMNADPTGDGVGTGGQASSGVGDTKHSGGDGAAKGVAAGGGGGGAGGKTGNGQPGVVGGAGGDPGSGGTISGTGGDAGNLVNEAGGSASNFGGGGGGGFTGGASTGGCIALTWVTAT